MPPNRGGRLRQGLLRFLPPCWVCTTHIVFRKDATRVEEASAKDISTSLGITPRNIFSFAKSDSADLRESQNRRPDTGF